MKDICKKYDPNNSFCLECVEEDADQVDCFKAADYVTEEPTEEDEL